jgi:hypothetical protein
VKAYEECLSATSTRDAPWYVVPADDKENARLIVSQIVLDTLEGLKMVFPETSATHLLMPCETETIADRIVVVMYADATAPGNREEDLETLAENRHVFETGYLPKKDSKSGFSQGIHGLSSRENASCRPSSG